jgi:sortase A
VEIIIPSIQIDLKVDPGQIKDGVWLISETNATFLNTSSTPGNEGNTVIYGHNKKVIFGSLPYLSIGQKIIIKTTDGKIYTYEVYEKDFVGSDRVDLVSPTNKEELTVYTCWGIFDTQRAVIKAKLI